MNYKDFLDLRAKRDVFSSYFDAAIDRNILVFDSESDGTLTNKLLHLMESVAKSRILYIYIEQAERLDFDRHVNIEINKYIGYHAKYCSLNLHDSFVYQKYKHLLLCVFNDNSSLLGTY